MMVTIAPFTVDSSCDCKVLPVGYEEEHIKRNHPPITYWGIYLNDKHISHTSSKEQAEKTKLWMEKWLRTDFKIGEKEIFKLGKDSFAFQTSQIP